MNEDLMADILTVVALGLGLLFVVMFVRDVWYLSTNRKTRYAADFDHSLCPHDELWDHCPDCRH